MTNENWNKLRAEAATYQAEVENHRQLYQKARENRQFKMARQIKQMLNQSINLRDTANRTAAEALFNWNNRELPMHVIDLHGLYLKEAVKKLEDRIKAIDGAHNLEVIVGKGLHSKKDPVIKPMVINLAENNKIGYSINQRNTGRVNLFL